MRLGNLYWRMAGTIAAFSMLAAAAEGAAPAADSLLPKLTSAFVSSPDATATREAWEKSQLGQLSLDARMKPFVDSFRDQIKDRLAKAGKKLGIAWEDLEGVPGGEIAAAVAPNAAGKPANVLLVDITGNRDKADAMLRKVDASLTGQGARRAQQRIAGEDVRVYTLPLEKGQTVAGRAYHLVKDDRLIACDDAEVLAEIIGRWAGNAKDSLATAAVYREVMGRVAAQSADARPHVRWFIDPFALVETVRAGQPRPTTVRHRDAFKALKNQGYTAVQGIGGHVTFSTGSHEILHRSFIYAPRVARAAEGEKYLLAARALDFPNSGGHEPPRWTPGDVAGFASINLKPAKAFAASKSLINDLANDPKTEESPGFIDDILEGIKTDKAGPLVDIEGEIIGNLGTRAVVITDYDVPTTPTGERILLAVEAKDPARVAGAIDRLMRADVNAKEMKIAGVRVWMMTEPPPEEDIDIVVPAKVVVMGGDGFVATAQEEDEEQGLRPEERLNAPNSAWAVAHGQLFRASHIDLLRRVLEQAAAAKDKPLSKAADFQRVAAEMEALRAGENSFRFFGRTEKQARPTYDLLRAGRLPESESIFGRVLNRLFNDPKSVETRKQRIDGSKLPEFEMAARYLGPAGTFVTSVEDGWVVTGFTLRKRAEIEVGRAPK